MLVVVYTDDAQVLLLRRRQPFDFWQSVTGSLQDDESHSDAAARELREETGFTDEGQLSFCNVSRHFKIDPRWRDRFEPGVVANEEFEWRYRLPAVRDIEIDNDEHSEYLWLHVDEAVDKVWSWTNKEALEQLREEIR